MRQIFQHNISLAEAEEHMLDKNIRIWNPIVYKTLDDSVLDKKLMNNLYPDYSLSVNENKYFEVDDGTAPGYLMNGTSRIDEGILELPVRLKTRSLFINPCNKDILDIIREENINTLLNIIQKSSQHYFLLLTLTPEKLITRNYLGNVILGSPVTGIDEKEHIEELKTTRAKLKFLLLKPIMEDLGELDLTGIDWVIVGAEEDADMPSIKKEYLENIIKQCREQKVPVYLQSSHEKKVELWDGNLIHEFPTYFQKDEYLKKLISRIL